MLERRYINKYIIIIILTLNVIEYYKYNRFNTPLNVLEGGRKVAVVADGPLEKQ